MTRFNDLLSLVCGMFVDRREHQHPGRKVAVEIVGRSGGTLRTGRLLHFADRPEEQQRFCNLQLAPARRMELDLKSFGDRVGDVRRII